jgi:NAD(P)-dependent dehydrogenase (short-subunit alcohol dehydrogenase family)
MRFADRTVIVTGSAQGIGRGIVQAFLDEGASVFAADINEEGLRGTAALAPERVKTHTVDLADFDQTRALVPAALEAFGRIHVLVNCAGMMPDGPLLDVTRETFDRTFAVNARAPMVTMQSRAPQKADDRGGAVV